ncbi:hypothetical protein QTG54_003420 [Skeletonema marinoi]|uniref:Complex 1 LYR protein domain-containing protein n=1 Tax=Skeletonema marinoi TaxID=267567 RepID=A0AAD9DF94_9STRA|nr:hypothetical protein QTG54_003420 [Skeletonema marinoi]
MSGIAHAAVRSLAGPSIKRSSFTAVSSSSWRRQSPFPISSTLFSTSSPSNNNNPPSTTAASQPITSTSSSLDNNNNTHRIRALSLYRQLLRGAERMPTPNRQNYVKRKTRSEFRRHVTLTDQEEIEFQLRLADTNLDTVLVQAEHLSRLFNDPEYQNYN